MPITWPHSAAATASPSTSSLSYPSDDSFSASDLSDADTDDDDEADAAARIQEEWDESLRQMETLLSIIVLPYFGKWFGRQWAFWAYDRYRQFGWTKPLLGLR